MTRRLFATLALGLGVLALVARVNAQPPGSPHETVKATVGGASISVEYGRPYMRGRKIMGSLVPYDHVWRTGADAATTLSTSKALAIGGATVPAGKVTLYTLPAESRLEADHQQADRPVGHGVRPGSGPGARRSHPEGDSVPRLIS